MAKAPPSLARRGLKLGMARGKPLGMAVVMSSRGAARDAGVSVMDAGDRAATDVVAGALGAPVRAPRLDDLAVTVLGADADLDTVADRLEAHRRAGGDVLVAVVGDAAVRHQAIAALRRARDLGIGVAFPVERLDDRGLEALRDAVVRRLGPRAPAVSRVSAPLRHTATDGMIRRGALRAGVIGALSGSRASSTVLTGLQARLAADVGNLAGEQPQAVQAGEAVGVALAAPVWRQAARGLTATFPGSKPFIRAAVAYGVTYLVGLVSARLRRVSIHSGASEEER